MTSSVLDMMPVDTRGLAAGEVAEISVVAVARRLPRTASAVGFHGARDSELRTEDLDLLRQPLRTVEPASPRVVDMVETWGLDSFPASDPPSNW